MTDVSKYMITLMGLATIRDHRSAAPAARVLGVISPNVTMTTVMTNGAIRTRAGFPPARLIARAVPKEDAKIMKAFSVRRMVAKNFSWCSNTRVTTRADRFPCSARYLILSLLTDIRLASALLKKATRPIHTTITII